MGEGSICQSEDQAAVANTMAVEFVRGDRHGDCGQSWRNLRHHNAHGAAGSITSIKDGGGFLSDILWCECQFKLQYSGQGAYLERQ